MQLKSVISDLRPWIVCAAAFIVHFLMGGLVNCGGVMYTALLEEFESGRGATGNYLIIKNWIKRNWIDATLILIALFFSR